MMQISHNPKLAPATLSALRHPMPKNKNSPVPKNSAMHCAFSESFIVTPSKQSSCLYQRTPCWYVEYFKAYYKKPYRQNVGNLKAACPSKSCWDSKFLLSLLLKQARTQENPLLVVHLWNDKILLLAELCFQTIITFSFFRIANAIFNVTNKSVNMELT